MRKEKILNVKVKILTEDQRKEYFEDGGVKVCLLYTSDAADE